METETAYMRYKRVLEEIADGADNPAERATDALRSRKIVPTLEQKTVREAAQKTKRAEVQKKKSARRNRAQEFYRQWIKAGYPPIAPFARNFGLSRESMDRLLELADKEMMPHDQRRLCWSYRTTDFKTVAEVQEIHEIKHMVWQKSGKMHLPNPEWRIMTDAVDRCVIATRSPGLTKQEWLSAAIEYFKKHNPGLWETRSG